MTEDIYDGLSLMQSLDISAAEAARIVVDVYRDRSADDPVTPDILSAYDDLKQRLQAQSELFDGA